MVGNWHGCTVSAMVSFLYNDFSTNQHAGCIYSWAQTDLSEAALHCDLGHFPHGPSAAFQLVANGDDTRLSRHYATTWEWAGQTGASVGRCEDHHLRGQRKFLFQTILKQSCLNTGQRLFTKPWLQQQADEIQNRVNGAERNSTSESPRPSHNACGVFFPVTGSWADDEQRGWRSENVRSGSHCTDNESAEGAQA